MVFKDLFLVTANHMFSLTAHHFLRIADVFFVFNFHPGSCLFQFVTIKSKRLDGEANHQEKNVRCDQCITTIC